MFDHILVPLDGSSLAECVLPHAVAMAQAVEAQVTLLRVLERPRSAGSSLSVDPLSWHIRKAEASAYLDGIAGRLSEIGLNVNVVILEGQAAEQIIDFTQDHGVSLVVLSSHGRSGLSGWNISSVVQKIILRAYMPAMIVRAYQPTDEGVGELRYRRLLVPLDGSQRAECVFPLVVKLAQHHQSRVLLTSVVNRPELPRRAPLSEEEQALVTQITDVNRRETEGYLETLRGRLSAELQIRLLISDNTAATLHDLVDREGVDLVILSAHGYSGESKWPYGGIALNFIAYGTTPLLIVQDLSTEEVKRTRAEMAAREQKGH